MRILGGPLKGLKWLTQTNYKFLIGNYEPPTVSSIKKFVSGVPDLIFFDIGANVGYFSFVVTRLNHNSKVYSFDPLPDNVKIFDEHLRINRSENIELLPIAISNMDGEVNFTIGENLAANTYMNSDNPELFDSHRICVEARSIDSFVKERGITCIHVLKIDVEGAEFDVLVGAAESIIRFKPIILLATHEPFVAGVEGKCLDILLNKFGYRCSEDDYYEKTNGLKDFICVYENGV
jgi:FkbM family methyltransferase